MSMLTKEQVLAEQQAAYDESTREREMEEQMRQHVNETTFDTIVKQFCSDDELRPELMQIHCAPPMCYASNGHILIGTPMTNLSQIYPSVEKYPDVTIKLETWSTNPLPNPRTIPTESLIRALQGVGTHVEILECSQCEGVGCKYLPDVSENDKDLPQIEPCTCCDGDGSVPGVVKMNEYSERIQIGAAHFNPRYIDLIAQVAQYFDINYVIQTQESDTKHNIFLIRDVQIYLMPVRQEGREVYKIHVVGLPDETTESAISPNKFGE